MQLLRTSVGPAARAGGAVAVLLLVGACAEGGLPSGTGASASTSSGPSSASSSASASTSAAPQGGATGSGLSESVVITAPADGERLPAGPVGITGTGTAFEGNLLWSITQADGTVLADGSTTAGANGEVGGFAVQQQVQAGSCDPCTARVWAPDESGGEGSVPGGPETAATVTFSVG